jgi:ribosomal protein S6--L-glutamate ligase
MYSLGSALGAADWVLFPEYWQVDPLVYGFKCRIFPSIATYHIGHDKVGMTRALWAVRPDAVPLTRIARSGPLGREEILDTFDFPFVAKDIRSAGGAGVFRIDTVADWAAYERDREVLYVQEYLPIRRDLRVVVIGDRIAAAYWRESAEGMFHTNVARGGRVSDAPVPAAARDLVLTVAEALSIDHAGFDVAEVDGRLYIFELNPFFGHRGLAERGIRPGVLIHDHFLRIRPVIGGPEVPGDLARAG